MSKTRFMAIVWEAMTKAGLQAKDYARHSFRIGVATTAGARGIPDSTIKMLGRWESSAYPFVVFSFSNECFVECYTADDG